MSSLIELKEATKIYHTGEQELYALNHVDLTIGRGEFVSLMGESGAGKSTTMNMIGLLDQLTSGQYILDDKDVSQLSRTEKAHIRNQKIGFVFQSFFLLPRLTSIENIMLPLSYRGVQRGKALEAAEHMLERLNLTKLAYKKPNQMSGGQQQRIAIARALVGDPDVILADEPTGALDSKTSHEIMMFFSELYQKENRTVIMVTHDPIVSAYTKRVIIMSDGKIVSDFENEHPGEESVKMISDHFLAVTRPEGKTEESADEA